METGARQGFGFIQKPGDADLIRGYDDDGVSNEFGLEPAELFDGDDHLFHHYVLVSYAGGPVNWYRDKTLVFSAISVKMVDGNYGGTASWVFGGNSVVTESVHADEVLIDEFAIGDKTLSAVKISEIYQWGRQGKPLDSFSLSSNVIHRSCYE